MDAKRFVLICLASLGVHLVFFMGIFWFHDFDFKAPRPRVVTVDLVSFESGPTGGAPEPQSVEEPANAPENADVNLDAKPVTPKSQEPAAVPVLTPDLSLKTKPKNIKDLMAERDKKAKPKPQKPKEPKTKPRPDPEKELQKAREALAQKVEQQKEEQIQQALERMKAAISQKENSSQAGTGPGLGEGTGDGRNVSDPEKLYQMVIASAIRQNWVFNDTLARMNKNLECRVLVKILKSGEIRDIIFETRSGNLYLDESVRKAILRSNPLPSFPMGWPSYDIGFVFSPRGLK